ncbi:MAG: prephenate dehydratase [Phycisphaerae bacterium]|nr:prephenate dehydratase [Phycisphaerae bacterium]
MNLQDFRQKIDEIDRRLVQLMNERAKAAIEIGKLKDQSGASGPYVPEREQDVFSKVLSANEGPLSDNTLKSVWKELMSGSLSLEKPLKIAFLGPVGSFSHLASVEKFGTSVEHVTMCDIATVFDQVARGNADYGLVPVENTTGGAIRDTMEGFLNVTGPIKICAEMAIAIHQNLLGNCALEQVRSVYSKPEVFDQCRGWLSANVPNADLVGMSSTAEAAKHAAKEEGAAAIASALAVEIYQLNILSAGIEDNPQNMTRFLVLGRAQAGPTGRDKTSLLFGVAHKSGALVDVLKVFHRFKINMTKIESHPSPAKKWEYYFFVDIEGHTDDENVKKALAEVQERCRHLEILGSFPVAVMPGE